MNEEGELKEIARVLKIAFNALINTHPSDKIYATMYGSVSWISWLISNASGEAFRPARVKRIIEMCQVRYFRILPELNERQRPVCMPIVQIEQDKVHFMIHAFEYHDTLKKRHHRCVETCVALLSVAPFQQKDLRNWWVRHMVFSTWANKVWENNAEEQRVSSSSLLLEMPKKDGN